MRTPLKILGLLLAVAGGLVLLWSNKDEIESGESAEPSLSLKTPPYLMSCAYKTYKDPTAQQGRFWAAKVVLKNPGETSYHDLEIRCQVPGLAEWCKPQIFPEVLPGQTVVYCYYPDFPDSITKRRTSDRENVEIEISWKDDEGGETTTLTRELPVEVLGVSQLAYTDIPPEEIQNLPDYYATSFFTACFVTPNDPIIRYLTQRIQSMMGGSVANTGDPEEIRKFMRAAYMVLGATGIRYGGTTGMPVESGGVETTVQEIRLPREIVTGSAGLCIELSNLFCSIFEAEGLQSAMFLTNNHAWPAVIMPDGSYLPVESTMVGTATFDQAVQAAVPNTNAHLSGGQWSYTDQEGKLHSHSVIPMGVLHLRELHAQGIEPIELKENPDLRRRLDEVLARAEQVLSQQPDPQPQPDPNPNDPQPQPADLPNSQPLATSFGMTMSVPNNFQVLRTPIPQIPSLELAANEIPDGGGLGIEFYSVGNARSLQEAVTFLEGQMAQMGVTAQYQIQPPQQEGGPSVIVGQSFANGQAQLEWIGVFNTTNQGVTGVIFNAPLGKLEQYNNLIQQMVATIR